MGIIADPPRPSIRLEATSPASSHGPAREPVQPPQDLDAPRGESRQVPAEGVRPLPSLLAGLRVLVVDDDADTRELFTAVLVASGAQVSMAGSAGAALDHLGAQSVDVVLSDIAMPGGDGYWLVRAIRSLPDARANALPVVAVTAFGREHFRARALAAGFAAHLQKPTDPELLCRTVATAAGR